VNRRQFIGGLGLAAWPVVARGQQNGRMRQVGVLLPYQESDALRRADIFQFRQQLAELGWIEGRNFRIEIRAGGSLAETRRLAKELVALQPDVILSDSTPPTAALQLETRSVPIVFVMVSDPIGSGFVAGLPRPGGNLTGFTHLEGTVGGKWLELLKQVVPGLKRAAAMFNPATAPYVKTYYLPAFEAAARLSNVEPLVASVGSDAEIVETIRSLGEQPGGGLVLMSDSFVSNHMSLINSLATQERVPSVSWHPDFPQNGGLLSYGADTRDIYRRAASYVDRVLSGENPGQLPVQAATKFIMVVNLRTAKSSMFPYQPAFLPSPTR
jgi:putative tryptophan/tyrosine transport system substrate-binding protein